MIGHGKNAQYVMSGSMSMKEAEELAEEIVMQFLQGEWVRIGHTYVNPDAVSTLRVVREKETIRYETAY
jgi:hypothetical protein